MKASRSTVIQRAALERDIVKKFWEYLNSGFDWFEMTIKEWQIIYENETKYFANMLLWSFHCYNKQGDSVYSADSVDVGFTIKAIHKHANYPVFIKIVEENN